METKQVNKCSWPLGNIQYMLLKYSNAKGKTGEIYKMEWSEAEGIHQN